MKQSKFTYIFHFLDAGGEVHARILRSVLFGPHDRRRDLLFHRARRLALGRHRGESLLRLLHAHLTVALGQRRQSALEERQLLRRWLCLGRSGIVVVRVLIGIDAVLLLDDLTLHNAVPLLHKVIRRSQPSESKDVAESLFEIERKVALTLLHLLSLGLALLLVRLVARLLVPDADEGVPLVLFRIVGVIVVVIIVVVIVVVMVMVMMDHQPVTGTLVGHRCVRGRVRVRVTVIPIIKYQ